MPKIAKLYLPCNSTSHERECQCLEQHHTTNATVAISALSTHAIIHIVQINFRYTVCPQK